MHRPLTAILRDTRGAAYTEAVIVIPVFILLWAAVIHVGGSFQAKSVASQTARRCAWAYANGGCDDVPEGCEGVVGGADRQFDDGDIDDVAGDDGQKIRDGVQQISDPIDDSIGEIPVAGDIIHAIVGTATTATAGVPVKRPKVLGGQRQRLTTSYTVMCNEREKTLGSIVTGAFCSLTGIGC